VIGGRLVKVFIIPFHVRRMAVSIMPTHFLGAYVSCYSPSNDYSGAVQKALTKLSEDGLYPEEILQPVYEMNAGGWSEHVDEKWPDQAGSLLGQAEFEDVMKRGGVVYGPFGSYA
jgi:hypothetical protein